MVTVVLVGIASALAVLVAVLVAVLIGRRASRDGQDRLALAMTERMEALMSELTGALQQAEEAQTRSRVLGEIGSSIDLDEVLSRALEAAGAIQGADAAMISMTSADGKPLVATLGLSTEEAQRQAITGPPDGRQARSVGISYTYASEDLAPPGGLIHSGLAVPVSGEFGQFGFLTIFARSSAEAFSDKTLEELETLARRAGPAIENARRFREARQLADLDALTGLHNRRYFHETLAREVARAQRYNRQLALIVFDLDDFKSVNDRVGHLAGDAVLAEAAERVRDVVRSADIACRVGGDEFAVILPESTLADADQLYRRIQAAVSSRPISQVGKLYLSAGVTELRPEDDAVTFFQRADEALYRAKHAGKGQVVAAAAETES